MKPGAPQTVRDHILFVERRLRDAHVGFGHGTDNARDEAAWLVGYAIGSAPDRLAQRLRDRVDRRTRSRIARLLAARIRTRAPLAYLIHEAWFAGRSFYVDPRTIVPRSLIGEFLMPGAPSPLAPAGIRSVLDLCTGSGAIAVAAAYAFPKARVDAADISTDALRVAARNRRRHRLERRLHLIESDLFSALSGRRYDLILSNPPYVSTAEMRALPTEYRREPELALAAGREGLDLAIPILKQAADHLTARGRLVLEVGASRAHLEAAYPEHPFLWLASSQDDCVGYWHRDDLLDHPVG
ncbi:MAG: 50S ribosomal protein L3 N(5)-glutamine methyltransferase [Gammaproteobacteria bacterium]|nr:50S ribosomal protein L3 N(5)-glutamine methyltransferase [Gammaproteobacteria bacterium]